MRNEWIAKNWLMALAGLAAAALGAWLGLSQLDQGPVAVPDALWSARFADLRGAQVVMHSFKGKPVVLNFWATWCIPCKEEMPDFQRLAASELGQRVQIVGIGIDNAKNMRAFGEALGISYTLLEGGPQGLDLLKLLGNQSGGLPYTLVIGADGEVVLRHLGKLGRAELEVAMRTALK